MANLTTVNPSDDVNTVSLPDVRAVPLGQLGSDPCCDDLVQMVMNRQERPSRVDVAMFNSAI
jgi:hypothetical protein